MDAGRCGGRVDHDKGTSRFVSYNRIPADPNFVDDTVSGLLQVCLFSKRAL